MGTRTNIGIYISPADKDIAAWFNLLERNHMSRSQWVRGLLAAYSLGQPLRIGVVDKRVPLIRDKDNPSDTVEATSGFSYGWHIRGPHREFVIGSVVNISIRNDEIKATMDEAWENGHKLAPFIKALIRQNLKTGDKDIPPKQDELTRVWSEFLVKNNSIKTKRKKAQELEQPPVERPRKPRPVREEEPEEDWVTPEPREPKPEEFTFREPAPPKREEPARTAPGLGKNPLLDQI